jgi:hypothetical protein
LTEAQTAGLTAGLTAAIFAQPGSFQQALWCLVATLKSGVVRGNLPEQTGKVT